jgi:hypothetical protein
MRWCEEYYCAEETVSHPYCRKKSFSGNQKYSRIFMGMIQLQHADFQK